MSVKLWQLHLCSTCVLNGSDSCGVIRLLTSLLLSKTLWQVKAFKAVKGFIAAWGLWWWFFFVLSLNLGRWHPEPNYYTVVDAKLFLSKCKIKNSQLTRENFVNYPRAYTVRNLTSYLPQTKSVANGQLAKTRTVYNSNVLVNWYAKNQ